MSTKITLTVFDDAEQWLKTNMPALVKLASVISPLSELPIVFVYPEQEYNPNGLTTYFDQGSSQRKQCSLADHVKALQLLSEQIGTTLFVGAITHPLYLTDVKSWSMTRKVGRHETTPTEVVDAFFQLVFHGEIIYT